jgi:carboxylesterase
MPGAEPFFYRGGATGVLCIHGFTANPSEVRWLGQHIAAQGHTVYGVRLAGHGSDPHDMARMRWRDWLASAQDGVHFLRGMCERVVLVGHSMGGLLALMLATQMDGITALSVLASPIRFPTRLDHARWLRYVRPFTDQSDTSSLQAIIRAEQARRGEAVVGRVRYNLWSTSAVYELVELTRQADAMLPFVTQPLQLIYSRKDATVPLDHANLIARRVRSTDIEQHTLETSGHILPQDVERETVFALVSAFVAKWSDSNAQSDARSSTTDMAADARLARADLH